jgi:predicted RNase H-like HicB family nuclease
MISPTIASNALTTYPVLVEQGQGNGWSAQVLGWAEVRSQGNTREEALHNLEHHLAERLARAEIVHLAIPTLPSTNPLLELAGAFKDDPQFDAMLEHIAAYRQELDAEMAADVPSSDSSAA